MEIKCWERIERKKKLTRKHEGKKCEDNYNDKKGRKCKKKDMSTWDNAQDKINQNETKISRNLKYRQNLHVYP